MKRPGGRDTRPVDVEAASVKKSRRESRRLQSRVAPPHRREHKRLACAGTKASFDRRGEDRMRSHLEEDVESLASHVGDRDRKPVGLGPRTGGDRAASSRLSVPSTYAATSSPMPSPTTRVWRDAPRLPERRQCNLEGELDDSIRGGCADSRRSACPRSARQPVTSRRVAGKQRRTARSRLETRARGGTVHGRRPGKSRSASGKTKTIPGRRPPVLRPCATLQCG